MRSSSVLLGRRWSAGVLLVACAAAALACDSATAPLGDGGGAREDAEWIRLDGGADRDAAEAPDVAPTDAHAEDRDAQATSDAHPEGLDADPTRDADPPGDAGSAPDADPTPDAEASRPDAAPPALDASLPDGGATSAPDAGLVLTYPAQRVGMFYLAWHAFAADAYRRVPPAEQLTVEGLIRDHSRLPSSILESRGLFGEAAAFHYHSQPALGFYCLYRRRPGEARYPEPNGVDDCPDISRVAEVHARQLWDAGIDFVYVDLTNLPQDGAFADVLGVRPLEVLLEEWAALRARGVPTPQIAAWVPAQAVAAPTYLHLLDLYARPEWADLILRHAPTGQHVMFVVNSGGLPADAGALQAIAARGVLPVPLWGNLSAIDLALGTAGWMQPCTDGGAFTTLVRADRPCAQGYAAQTPLGSIVSVSAAYQLSYASTPFGSSGRLDGLVLQKQFETAFAVQPNYLLVNAWNEHIAQPQPNGFDPAAGALRRSMGMSHVPASDPGADWLWVDAYGGDLSRDLEPTVESGDAGYQLLQSCLRVYRSGHLACTPGDVATEACCRLRDDLTLVRSFRAGGGAFEADHLITWDEAEVGVLRQTGWTEICNLFVGVPGLCAGSLEGDGPFLIPSASAPGRIPLYRCRVGSGGHFFSTDAGCEGQNVELLLGWMEPTPSSRTPRALTRCYNATSGAHLHWLDDQCPFGLTPEAILGYVR